MRLADLWPKRWLNAFVPEVNRKAAKKQCISGHRHVGFLWQAFTMGFIPEFTRGKAALEKWREHEAEGCYLFLPDGDLLYRLSDGISPEVLEGLGYTVLADEGMGWSFVRTGKETYYTEA